MYSVVLMMALSGGAESADFGHRKCSGNEGCSGNVAASCHGGRHARQKRDRGCRGSRCSGAPVCAPVCPPACSGGVYSAPGGMHPESMEPKMMPNKEKIPAPPKTKTKTTAAATVIVTLPAEARLTVDGNATSSTSERRTLVTPALETGADYVYTLRADLVRDGNTLSRTQAVTVRGGKTTNVPFTFSAQRLASR